MRDTHLQKQPCPHWRKDAQAPAGPPDEWQIVVDMAEGALVLDSTRKYGLVTGGPKVNCDRCVEIIDAGRERGIVPSPDAVERFIACVQQHEQAPH